MDDSFESFEDFLIHDNRREERSHDNGALPLNDLRTLLGESLKKAGYPDENVRSLGQIERKELGKTIPFDEVASMLQRKGIDLHKRRKEEGMRMRRWGLINEGQEEMYSDLFLRAEPSFEDIKTLMQKLEAGEKWKPLFIPGAEILWDFWNKLHDYGILLDDAETSFASLKEMNTDAIFEHHALLEPRSQHDLFQKIYESLGDLEPYERFVLKRPKPRLLFTPAKCMVKEDSSPAAYIPEMARGTTFIDPLSDLIRLISELDFLLQGKICRYIQSKKIPHQIHIIKLLIQNAYKNFSDIPFRLTPDLMFSEYPEYFFYPGRNARLYFKGNSKLFNLQSNDLDRKSGSKRFARVVLGDTTHEFPPHFGFHANRSEWQSG
jgi:hypothetical protein